MSTGAVITLYDLRLVEGKSPLVVVVAHGCLVGGLGPHAWGHRPGLDVLVVFPHQRGVIFSWHLLKQHKSECCLKRQRQGWGSDHLSWAARHALLTKNAALHDAAIEDEGAEDTEHDDDEHSAEDEEEILVKVELVLSVDDGSLLSAGVCPHDRMIFHFNSSKSTRSSSALDTIWLEAEMFWLTVTRASEMSENSKLYNNSKNSGLSRKNVRYVINFVIRHYPSDAFSSRNV